MAFVKLDANRFVRDTAIIGMQITRDPAGTISFLTLTCDLPIGVVIVSDATLIPLAMASQLPAESKAVTAVRPAPSFFTRIQENFYARRPADSTFR